MTNEEMAEEWIKEHSGLIGSYKFVKYDYDSLKQAFLAGLKAGKPKWHKVADGKLPELDKKVWTIRSADDDMPVIANRHIYTSYGRTEWEWECYWGSGFDLKQNEIFAWCEIPQFKDKE